MKFWALIKTPRLKRSKKRMGSRLPSIIPVPVVAFDQVNKAFGLMMKDREERSRERKKRFKHSSKLQENSASKPETESDSNTAVLVEDFLAGESASPESVGEIPSIENEAPKVDSNPNITTGQSNRPRARNTNPRRGQQRRKPSIFAVLASQIYSLFIVGALIVLGAIYMTRFHPDFIDGVSERLFGAGAELAEKETPEKLDPSCSVEKALFCFGVFCSYPG